MFPCTFPSLNLDSYHGTPNPASGFRPPEFSARGSFIPVRFLLSSEPERPARLLQLCRGLRQVFRNLNFFCCPQFRAACPRIAIALFFCCRYWLLRQQTEVTLL